MSRKDSDYLCTLNKQINNPNLCYNYIF